MYECGDTVIFCNAEFPEDYGERFIILNRLVFSFDNRTIFNIQGIDNPFTVWQTTERDFYPVIEE